MAASSVWAKVWKSVREVPMLFVTLGVFVALAILSLPSMSAYASWRMWIVAVLVCVTVIDTLAGMVQDIKDGHVGLDVLAVVAILSTLAVGEFWASWTVVLMIYSGSVIESYADDSAEQNLTSLLSATPQIAHRLSNPSARGIDAHDAASALVDIDANDVNVMDLLLVKPGETVPVDGVVMSERAVVNLSMINGEALPQTVLNAQRVPSGAINGSESFIIRATASAANSQYQRIVDLVRSAQNSRPQVVKTADLLAVPFTVIAFAIAGLAWFISGDPVRFAQVLVLATPCPLLISAPVAYLGGASRLAASGILIKGQEIIEQLTRVTDVFFDKTGTLTQKHPQVVRVERSDSEGAQEWAHLSDDVLLAAAGIIESYSIHILAQGISQAGRHAYARLTDNQKEALNPETVSHVVEHSGLGISAQIDGHDVRIGRESFAQGTSDDEGFHHMRARRTYRGSSASSARRHGRDLEPSSMAAYMSIDGIVVGRIILQDMPRAQAASTISELTQLGVRSISMLTGDGVESAQRIATQVGIDADRVHAQLLPEHKQRILNNVRLSRAEYHSSQTVTMMVGDGVNDAPVLAAADIGVAVTDGSSTAASETAHMVIMNDDISLIPRAMVIARRTHTVMLQAVVVGLALAIVGMLVSAFGVVPAVIGAFGQEAIDVISILWALNASREPRSAR